MRYKIRPKRECLHTSVVDLGHWYPVLKSKKCFDIDTKHVDETGVVCINYENKSFVPSTDNCGPDGAWAHIDWLRPEIDCLGFFERL